MQSSERIEQNKKLEIIEIESPEQAFQTIIEGLRDIHRQAVLMGDSSGASEITELTRKYIGIAEKGRLLSRDENNETNISFF